jgi:hypothetical protein
MQPKKGYGGQHAGERRIDAFIAGQLLIQYYNVSYSIYILAADFMPIDSENRHKKY